MSVSATQGGHNKKVSLFFERFQTVE